MPRKDSTLLKDLGRRLTGKSGQQYWRSLDELAGTAEFSDYLHREFPESASEWNERSERREFLRLMAASLALGGLTGCRTRQAERIVPYVRQPEQLVPGKPLFFATAAPLGGFGSGVLVESHMGRPTKIEGNPTHPASLGATSAQTQASLLGLYDPDRSQTLNYRRQIQTWDMFLTRIKPPIDKLRAAAGSGLRLLTPSITSPTLMSQLENFLGIFPEARWHRFDSVNTDNEHSGLELAFGRPLTPVYNFRRADVVLSLDADFLAMGPGQARYAREFSDRRCVAGYREGDTTGKMSRFYAVETTPTVTAAKADHRLPLRPEMIEAFARTLAARLGVPGVVDPQVQSVPQDWLSAVADDLVNYRNTPGGSCLVVAGPWQPPAVHSLAHAINAHLGAVGSAVRYCQPMADTGALKIASLAELVADMESDQVEMLVVLDANPVYDAPHQTFAEAIVRVPLKVHFGHYQDETSIACDWHIPALHYLESWGDIRAYDGTVTIQQPLISPLYGGRSPYELLSALVGEGGKSTIDIVRDHWQISSEDRDSEDRWQVWLHEGIVPDTAASSETVKLNEQFATALSAPAPADGEDLVVVFRPDPSVHDGQFANNGWLQELPKPFTKLTWENAALVGPATAAKLQIANGDMLRVKAAGKEITLPSCVLPGQANGVVTVHLGYGRTQAGRVGDGIGANANRLRTQGSLWALPVQLTRTGEQKQLASTQHHFLLDGRELIRSGTLEELEANPEHPPFVSSHHDAGDASLLPGVAYDGYKWGMVVDLNACTGCNACVVACQAENNIPVVGRQQVVAGREMHWLRIDTYYSQTPDNPTTHFQPLPCMHCEQAPCELVCPVAATSHSPSGINEMTYNRCVGTRYCSNNCPYKVRRFNFLHYNESLEKTPVLQLLQNPDVTVRARGVMEKCTYCVQRVNAARIEAEKAGRNIRDGEVVSACQAACPSQAIRFGDLNDSMSGVSKAHRSPLRYSLLEELNTKPRTTYLAEVRNPHASLAATRDIDHQHD